MVEVQGLIKSYSGNLVLDRVSLNVPAGSIFGILGRNGAGKTTFLETMIGLRKKNKGTIRIMGSEVDENSEVIKRWVGVQPQEAALLQRQTVEETLLLFSSFYGHVVPLEKLMNRLNLTELCKKQVRELSAGQKQRLMIAVAMAGDPQLLILDEPTSGLDPQVRRALWEVIREFKAEGRTVMITTHYMEEAEELCDQVAILHDSRFVAQGGPQQLIQQYAANEKKQNLEAVFIKLTGSLVRGGMD